MLTSEAMLELRQLSVAYGPVQSLSNATIKLKPGEIAALVGSNGAGKSTLLRAVSGLAPIKSGDVLLAGESIRSRRPHHITRLGVAHVPEGRRVVAPLSVEENLLLGALASGRRASKEAHQFLEEMYQLFPRLKERRGQTSGLLSGGEQQMLAIARALMSRPTVLLLDEPSMGLAPLVVDEIYDLLRVRPGYLADISILLAEQSTSLALSVASRAYVLVLGEIVYAGDTDDLTDDIVQRAYFGTATTTRE